MKVGIFNVTSGKSVAYRDIYCSILDYNNIPWVLLEYNSSFWQDVKECDYYIHRFIGTDHDMYIARSILPVIENELNIPCYPDIKTHWTYEDKIREYFLMKTKGFPIVNSHIFFDKKTANEWVETCELPMVFKLRAGAGSSNVVLVGSRSKAKKLIRRMFGKGVSDAGIPGMSNLRFFNLKNLTKHYGIKLLTAIGRYDSWQMWSKHKNYIIFQDFMPGNEFDTRITVIGGRAFAFRRMNRKNDFRSSGSGLIDYDTQKIDMRLVKLALEISAAMEFQSMAYDFLFDKDGNPVFCEFSYTFNDKAIAACPGYWDMDLNFHEGHYWPQFLVLKDLMPGVELKQPDLV